MSINMSWIWLLVVSGLALFQINFTWIETVWEISYLLQGNNETRAATMVVSSIGRSMSHTAARYFIEKKHGEEVSSIVILAVDKTSDERVFLPFWRR